MISKRIKKLRNLIKINNLDAYIIPKNDENFSEYSFPNRLKTISGFSGSAGFAIVLNNINYLFVDGRYTTQAKIESGKNFKIIEIPYTYPFQVLGKRKLNIGFDPNLFTESTLKRYFNKYTNLAAIKKNLIDKIYLEKKSKIKKYFFHLNSKVTGETTQSKIKRLNKILKDQRVDNLFISAPENVAWLLNLRGSDNPNSPIPNSKLIVSKKKIILFSDLNKIKNVKKLKVYKKINFEKYIQFSSILNKLQGKNFCIDENTCSLNYKFLIKSKFKIIKNVDPCYELKAIKNKTELNNTKKAHIYDGIALTKFLYWMKNKKTNGVSELSAEKKLENFRKKNKNFLYPSFNTIAGTGPNGAIIHYRANKKTNRKIKKNDIFLCDSGGQYKFGTTDVTRTICFTNQNRKIKNIFTRVLKGHIAVAITNLKKINKGYLIDKRARKSLREINLDYGHGTGHGVGFFLNVHEGPQSISKYNKVKIKEGMILSNEPGYYKENKFGIRIENLVYVAKKGSNLFFKNLTFAPIDIDLINFKLLNKIEKKYLANYHSEIYSKISKYLSYNEKKWIQKLI